LESPLQDQPVHSYRHAYHAGNIGDVLKHAILSLLVRALLRKASPFFFLDTHAGSGLYDLTSLSAQKTKEYQHGIARVLNAPDPPAALAPYLAIVAQYNAGARQPLRYYPGSPGLVLKLRRDIDRMVLVELNRHDAESLRAAVSGEPAVQVQQGDGWRALKAYVPPKERRGMVLIDPAYENPEEFERVTSNLLVAYRRWPTGVYVVWYPLLAAYPIRQFQDTLKRSGIRKVLFVELAVHPLNNPVGLNGSGIVIVNPPWQFDTDTHAVLPWLHNALLESGQGEHRCEWLVPE
jgi:23S rRNA (adenine2030-N6)-methyltransferase